jgi:hypothetical protein
MPHTLILLPPEGAARVYGLQIFAASQNLSARQYTLWDTKQWLDLYDRLLEPASQDPKSQHLKPLELVPDFIGQALLAKIVDQGIDSVLVLALCPITAYWIQTIRKTGCKTLHWFYEDARIASYWRQVASVYDAFLGIQGQALAQEVQQLGGRYFEVPTAVDASSIRTEWVTTKVWDLCFVGIPSPYRIRVLEFLGGLGLKIAVAGPDWPTGPWNVISITWLPQNEAFSLYQNSHFNINLSLMDPDLHDGRRLQHLSPRAFEIATTMSIPCYENVDQLKFLSDFSHDFICFNHEKDLAEQIFAKRNIQISHETIQKRIAKITQEHTWERRLQRIEEILKQV